MPSFMKLIASLDRNKQVFIQTHDFPDHDALASANGLKYLLEQHGFCPRIVYSGLIIRGDLKDFIKIISIPAESSDSVKLEREDQLIIVDGFKGNRNMCDIGGDLRAIIDHHPQDIHSIEPVPFIDLHSDYGSCSTIIASYFQETDTPIPKNIATAFLAGLYIDTSFLTRGVSSRDIDLINICYFISDREYLNVHVRNKIQASDLPYFRYLLKHLTIADLCGFCYLPQGCEQNLMGILADFCLGIQEVRFVLLIAKNNGGYSISSRSEKSGWDAAEIVKALIEPEGFGGGHAHMAGGVIKDRPEFHPNDLKNQLYAYIRKLLA